MNKNKGKEDKKKKQAIDLSKFTFEEVLRAMLKTRPPPKKNKNIKKPKQ